ncbi:uncharacterized protein TNCV_37251 [Trichonephila clavipes]|nr:uncharacterized protein TNCV_37251 [Trichonephila clavipes]
MSTCTVYEYVFEQCGDSLERQSLENAWNKLWPDLEREKDFNEDHREEITDFVISIPGFQEYNEDVETWMSCDAEDWGFQMLNDDEIMTSVQEESDPVDDETHKDEENNNNESNNCPSNANTFSALETAIEWYEQQSECCPIQLLLLKRIRDLAAKNEGLQWGKVHILIYLRKYLDDRLPGVAVPATSFACMSPKRERLTHRLRQPVSQLLDALLCQVIYSQFGLAIHQNDHQARRRFVEWAQNEIAVVPDFHKRILFSDEAHFWLNGYVNKQNCRIWSEANPQVCRNTVTSRKTDC